MATKKAAGAAKAAKAAKKASKEASHTVAKATKKAAKKMAARAPSPEKERSATSVGAGTVGAPAFDSAVAPDWAQEGDVLTTATGTPVD
ncbi:MAG: hypothetical protein QOD63_118, partial [Actinomycetota bacterium]|nr:hypothetical protein [Actinomycetota bacterium]